MVYVGQHNVLKIGPFHNHALHSNDSKVQLHEESAATLLDLPNELLLQILSISSILSPRDLFIISFLSRRLHSLALPLFLANHGIQDPERETSIYVIEWNPKHIATTNQPDALSGLSTLTTISRVDHFRCFFQDPDGKSFRNTFQQAFNLPYAIKRVSRFVQKLKHVGTAEIYLMWDPYFVTHERSITHVPISEIRRWTNAFGHLLNLLVVRGCTSLTVQYDPTIQPPFQFRSTNRVMKAFSYLSHSVLRRDGQSPELEWEFQQPGHENKFSNDGVDPPVLPSRGQAFSCITSLSIHSPILLLPPFINWTLSLLRTHPRLISISFAYISFSKDIWATLLPFIADAASENLTQLSFFKNCPHLDAADLLQFLCQFPNLQHLTVDRSFRPRLQEIKPPKSLLSSALTSNTHALPTFPHLHTLHAPLELVSLLLDVSSIKDRVRIALPQLRDLFVYPSSRLIHPPSYIASSLAVNSLLDRVASQPRAHEVVFSLDAQMEFTDFGSVIQYIESINTRGEFRRSVWETLAEADIQQLTQGGHLPLIAFVRITHLFLYRFNVRFPGQTPATLCLWIKILFPNLERLTFTCQLEAHPLQDVEMDPFIIQELIRMMNETCPKMRVIVVGQKTYDL